MLFLIKHFFRLSLILLVMDIQIAKSDREKLYINSNKLIINRKKMEVEFIDNVLLWFDDLMIKTTYIKVFYKIIGNIKVIKYILIPFKLTGRNISGTNFLIADSGKYIVSESKLILSGEVVIAKEGSILKTNEFIYHIKVSNKLNSLE